MKKQLIIERGKPGEFWGWVKHANNLIVENAPTIQKLETRLRKLLKAFHGLDPNKIEFEHKYDLSALFEKFSFLKISSIAEHAEMNSALLRQYVAGIKSPTKSQAL